MLKDLVIANRSRRGYDPSRRVTKEELMELVDLARLTPSTCNFQALKFHIAYEAKEVADILALTKWAGSLPELHLPYPGTEPAAFIVICRDLSICKSDIIMRDVGITAQTMLLGATEMGLGGLMIGSFNKEKLVELLRLSENLDPNLVVAIGKPAETVILTEVDASGSTTYYRDAEGKTHYVPKRSLESILV